MFKCTNCKWEGEELSKIPLAEKCPTCGDEVEKVVTKVQDVEAPKQVEKKINLDLNNDGKIDGKDSKIASKVMNAVKRSRKRSSKKKK